MNVAIIPARGGSKRIPRKNIKLFNALPMISYAIKTAQQSGCFDRIIVSTEDEEIAVIARSFGAETPFIRPAELADDYVSSWRIIQHALRWLDKHCDGAPDMACCIYATTPLLNAEALRQGLESLQSMPDKQFAFAVTSFPFPIQRAIRITPNGGVEPFQPECIPKRSQDLEPAYHDAGQFYWGRKDSFMNNTPLFSSASIPILIPRYRVQDIDTEEDWLQAEYMHTILTQTDETTNAHCNQD